MIKKQKPLQNADPKAIKEDHAAYQRNEKATEKNRQKDNAPKTRFDSPNRIGSGEELRNDGDKGGAD